MSEQDKKKKVEKLVKNFQISRQDTANPHKKIENVPLVTLDDDEDEITAAKSMFDEIVEETERET